VLVGGGDAQRNFAEVWLARWGDDSVKFEAWPALPRPLAQAAGAVVGRTLFVAGGLNRPDSTQAQRVFYALDLDRRAAGWHSLDACPGTERFLAAAAAHDGAFYFIGGARLIANVQGKSQREWLRDVWRYRPGDGWKRLADLPRAAVAAPTPAPVVAGRVYVLGGDDGSQAAVTPTTHRGFPRDVLAYDPVSNHWSHVSEAPFSLVTTSATIWQGRLVVPGGEARPGVRSPAVWAAVTK
jgi:N-acetylneuraminic acid mutarotase